MRIVTVDAFTERPFAGNPAAVCLLSAPTTADWMQQLAREINLSETAFLCRQPDGDYSLRWFTPALEVDLCGHATLASAHVLWEEGHLAAGSPARFQTRSGLLTASRQADGLIEMDFPATPAEAITIPTRLAGALGLVPGFVGQNRFDYLVEAPSAAAVRKMQPDFQALAALPVRGVIVTARGEPPYDFVSRFFAPAAGVPEDPVTGSAHCCLGPFWQARLNKSRMLAYQASPRGGVVQVEVKGDRVVLGGRAVTVLAGELTASALPGASRRTP